MRYAPTQRGAMLFGAGAMPLDEGVCDTPLRNVGAVLFIAGAMPFAVGVCDTPLRDAVRCDSL